MRREKVRKFLPSFISPDITGADRIYVETGFLSKNDDAIFKVEHTVNLEASGTSSANMTLYYPHKQWEVAFDGNMDEDDAIKLLRMCTNKIKKYRYPLKHGDIDVYVNRYTLGIVIIEIDATKPLIDLPEYCGKEVTGDEKYSEVHLIHMKEQLRAERNNGRSE